MIEWLVENKEWIFSGAGVAIIAWILNVIYGKSHRRVTQMQQSGNDSVNIQAGDNVNILLEKDKNNNVRK